MPEDLTAEDILHILKVVEKEKLLNRRELHYLGVKLEFPKKALQRTD